MGFTGKVPLFREGHIVTNDNQYTLPSFLIIGAQKAGTTSLYHYLIQHPQIEPAIVKEVHYFDEQWRNGVEWYQSHFPYLKFTESITGEATPYYLFHPQAPKRVYHMLSDVKLIILLRNPIDRAYSHYQMMVRRGIENLSFEEAVASELERTELIYLQMMADSNYHNGDLASYSYVRRGQYIEQIRRWLKWFSMDQMCFINSEELFTNPEQTYQKVTRFLGLPDVQLEQYEHLHEGGYDDKENEAIRHTLQQHFKPYNERLFEYLNVSYPW